MKSKAFTLIELLITATIIGFLTVAGATGYGIVRAKARDTKRVADIRTIRNAIETYFEQNGKYPAVLQQGIVLGDENAKMISDAGITPFGQESGITYLQNVPYNILPNGVPYLYRSLDKDGLPCGKDCTHYAVAFNLETDTGEYGAGDHLLTEEGIVGPGPGNAGLFDSLRKYAPTSEAIATAFGSAKEVADLAKQAASRSDVQAANVALVAPVSVVGALASLIAAVGTAVPIANAGQLALFFFAQPFLVFSRRKRERWGTVYRSGTKIPVDLASVRLIDSATDRAVATKVTDKDGRYVFSPKPGTYRLEVSKPGFIFPSIASADLSDDGRFTDIYHGRLIETAAGQDVTVNIPLDPEKDPPQELREILSEKNKRQLRKTFALIGPLLGLIALAVTPSLPMLALFLVHLVLYQLFKRLSEPPAPKNMGSAYDIDSHAPVDRAIIRVFSLPYHKVLESRVTDAQGRYGFYVGDGMFYLTAVKPGYEKTETEPIDFTKIDKPAWIASDLPMRKARPKPVQD